MIRDLERTTVDARPMQPTEGAKVTCWSPKCDAAVRESAVEECESCHELCCPECATRCVVCGREICKACPKGSFELSVCDFQECWETAWLAERRAVASTKPLLKQGFGMALNMNGQGQAASLAGICQQVWAALGFTGTPR